ncbi:MAG: winged helix-turn-helix domain-containing protein [Oligoflexia bacterium]|nr:winged helix-turn-helix domain-containing protein [Oligoflexia bacterium]
MTTNNNNHLSHFLRPEAIKAEGLSVSSNSQARIHYRLGKVYFDKADLLSAERCFLENLPMWTNPQDIFFIFKVLGFLVRIASEMLDAEKTERYVDEIEKLLEQVRSSAPQYLSAEFYYNQGIVQSYRSGLEQALTTFELAAQKAREEKSNEVLAKATHAMAMTSLNLKDLRSALTHLDQLALTLKELHKSYLDGTYHLLRANVYSELNEHQLAIKHYQESQKVLVEKGCWNLYGKILLGEGIIYKKTGEFNRAIFYFEMAQKSINPLVFKKLATQLENEIADVRGSNIDLVLDMTNRMIYEKNLGPIDFKHRFILLEILYLLIQNLGRYFNKEDLAKAIWKDEYNPLIHDKLIYTSVSRLRKLIEPKRNSRSYIIRGQNGYTFNPRRKVRLHRDNEIDKKTNTYGIELSSPV